MEKLLEMMENIERLVLIMTNIILALYSLYATIKARRWKQTAHFVGGKLQQEEEKTIPKPKTKEKLVFASPKPLKAYMTMLKI